MTTKFGLLAKQFGGVRLAVQVLKSARGYYIGCQDAEGPVSRESVEYYSSVAADASLETGNWTQRERP